jgi:RNA polymerase sigma-70 factor (ECF subfamily)
MTDHDLVEGCRKGKRRFQTAMYKKYFPLMSSLALRYGHSSDDVVEQINMGFLKVLNNIHKYDNKHALATWIRVVLVRHLIDEFRKNHKEQQVFAREDIQQLNGHSHNDGAQKLEAEDLLRLLKLLPDMTRHVFSLFAIDGFKHSEIGEMLNISSGTSKWHVNQARNMLKEKLSQQKEQEQVLLKATR